MLARDGRATAPRLACGDSSARTSVARILTDARQCHAVRDCPAIPARVISLVAEEVGNTFAGHFGSRMRRQLASTAPPTDAETVLSLVAERLLAFSAAAPFELCRATSADVVALMLISRAVRDGIGPLLARQAAIGPSTDGLRAFYLSPTLSTLSPGLLQLLRLRLPGRTEDQQLAYAIISYAPCLQHLDLDMLDTPVWMLLAAIAATPLRILELRQRAACPGIVQLVPRLAHLRRLGVDAQCGASSLGRIIGAVCTRRGVELVVESQEG